MFSSTSVSNILRTAKANPSVESSIPNYALHSEVSPRPPLVVTQNGEEQNINMRVSQAVIAFSALCGSAAAFSVSPSFGVARQNKLYMSDAVAEAEPQVDVPKPAPTGMSMGDVRKAINSITAANFSETLSKLEPFFLNEAGSTIYVKSMKRIAHQAKMNGVEVPKGYAKEAAANAKRVARQNAFIEKKEAERIAREEEEAAAAAAAVEAAAAAAAEEETAAAAEEATAEPVES